MRRRSLPLVAVYQRLAAVTFSLYRCFLGAIVKIPRRFVDSRARVVAVYAVVFACYRGEMF